MGERRALAVGVTPLESRPDVVLRLAERAEELGYDAFYLAEGWGHDAGVLLSQVAARTSRIGLGTGILNTWGRSPAGFAMLAASMATVSGGRFTLGLGSGSPPLAEGWHGVPFDRPVARLGEVAREVRRLLAGERSGTSLPGGERPLRLSLPTPVDVSIHLAALGPRAVRLTGQVADGWSPFLVPCSGLADGVADLREAEAGRDDAGVPVRVCPSVPLAVADDPVLARRIASWWVVFYLTNMGPLYRDSLTRSGLGEPVHDLLGAGPDPRAADVPTSAEVLLDELTLWGDADAGRAALDRWYDAGADMPILCQPPGQDVAVLESMLEAMAPGGQ